MHCIFQPVYGLINNSSLSICLLKTIWSVVFTEDDFGYWKNKIHPFKVHSISNEMPQIYAA